MKRLHYLDGLRGIAALLVATFSHYKFFVQPFNADAAPVSAPAFDLLWPIYEYSWFAVDIFFVISGLVFAHVYAARLPSASLFALRRFARLYPLHLVTLLAAAILAATFVHLHGRPPVGAEDTPWRFVMNLLFIQYGVLDEVYSFNTPVWSLSVEAVMYVLFFFAARSQRLVLWSVALCALGAAIILSRLTWHHWPLFNASMARGLIGFFGGVLIYRVGRWAWILPAAALIPAFLFVHPALWWAYTAIFSGMILIRNSTALQSALGHPICVWLGDRSLGVYLVHTPVIICILLVFGADPPVPSPAFMLAYVAALLIVAHLAYVGLERPAQTWLLKLGQQRASLPPGILTRTAE
jgi:peptidoglycan/LPS O-acetylase OafA/YrhL